MAIGPLTLKQLPSPWYGLFRLFTSVRFALMLIGAIALLAFAGVCAATRTPHGPAAHVRGRHPSSSRRFMLVTGNLRGSRCISGRSSMPATSR